ncbi:MAG: hypothetical protein AAGJ82_01305 [Bacteroidota bacterium]
MIEMDPAYLRELAKQTLFVCGILEGFSISAVVTLLGYERHDRVMAIIFCAAILSTAAFLLAIFGMTGVIMLTTEGYPLPNPEADLRATRNIASVGLLLGILSITTLLSASGWVKSKRLGWFTTVVGVLLLIAIMRMM